MKDDNINNASGIEETIPLQRKDSEIAFDNDDLQENEEVKQLNNDTETIPLKSIGSEYIDENIQSSSTHKKKEISWNAETNFDRVEQDLRGRSLSLILERKASVGPCRQASANGAPSGITIHLPKKSGKFLSEHNINSPRSGINLRSVSKGYIKSPFEAEPNDENQDITMENNHNIQDKLNIFGNFRGKIDNFCTKIKAALHMN